MADSACYEGGSIAGAVIGTFVATVILGGILLYLWNRRRAKNNPLHDLVLVEEGDRRAAGGGGNNKNFVYDNVGFLDDTTDPKRQPMRSPAEGAESNKSGKMVANQGESGNKKTPWGPFSFLFNRNSRNALDDSVLEEPQRYSVALKGHDFTGLGFNICGNMRDGIYIKDVMQRGPAAESKTIMPGDRITEMTVSFKHMVLEDALTILSYASPYEVSLEMMRIPEKSLLHKGISMSGTLHAHSSGQSGTNLSSTDRVCHPFFKSQSIDDLRKVGKEHLDLKVDQGMRKQMNGVKTSLSADVSMPAAVVVPNNENRSPSVMGFVKSRENASEAHQHEKQKGEKKTMSLSLDEVDTCKAPIVQEIKVSAVKPEVVPRLKSKAQNAKSAGSASAHTVVEAISPVIKMTYEKEQKIKEAADQVPSSAQLRVEAMEFKAPKQTVTISRSDVPDHVVEHMMNVSPKAPHVEIEMMPPEVTLQMENEVEPDMPVTKPDRSPKQKSEKEDSKSKEKKEEQLKEKGEQEKTRFSKFGIRVLPDIGLGFGRKSSTPEREMEKSDEKAGEKKDKDKLAKKDKSKVKEGKESSDTKSSSEDVSSEFQVSMTLQNDTELGVSEVALPKSKVEEEIKQMHSSDRPPSADSTGSQGEKNSRKSGFHMPSIGIKLPLFGHSKQYTLEPEKDAKSTVENSTSQIPSSSENDADSMPEVRVRKIEDTGMQMEMNNMDRTDSPKSKAAVIEIEETIVGVVTSDVEGKSGGEENQKPCSPEPLTEEKSGEKEKGAGFMSKGIQSLRDFKEKVTHKLSSHDQPGSSSDAEGDAEKEKAKKLKKEQRERSADAKLKEKLEKEERAREKAREKERLKAEKRAKKEEMKLRKKLSASKEGLQPTSDSSSSSSDASDHEARDPGRKKIKTKKSKSKEKQENTSVKVSSIDQLDRIMSDDVELDLTHVTTQAQPKMTPAKPPVAPRKSKESLKQKDSASDKDISVKKHVSSSKSGRTSSSSSSSSSESDDEEKGQGKKPKKPKRSTKRKAPVPPTPTATVEGPLITTSVEVIQHSVTEIHRYSPPEIVEATVKPKIQGEKLSMSLSGNVDTTEVSRVKSPDSGRSASYGDLSTLQGQLKHKVDPLERAASMDLTADSGNQESHISIMSPVEDLSNVANSNTAVLHYKPRESFDSLSSSSSSETLKSSSASIVHVSPSRENEIPVELQLHRMMTETAVLMNSPQLNIGDQVTHSTKSQLQENVFHSFHPEVTISTTGSSVMDHREVEEIARNAVEDVLNKVNGMEGRFTKEKTEKKPSKIPISKQSSLKNVTVMNIRDDVKPIKVDVQMEERSMSVPDIGTVPASADGKDLSSGVSRPKLLRNDSKSRLMQTVADANDIKMSPVSPGVRKDSSGSSSSISSTSSQSSPEIRVEANTVPASTTHKANGSSDPTSSPINGQTIEISSSELDGIMMSHSDFLSKQAKHALMFTADSPPKDSSFDNWVYVDQKHSQSHSTSPSDPSASSHDDDDDSGIQYSRSGALSPTTFKMETEYGTSELRVTSTPNLHDSSPQQTKVYSTTMTLPQKTITQIVLSPDPGQNISVVDGTFIVSKSHIDSESGDNKSEISSIPGLKH